MALTSWQPLAEGVHLREPLASSPENKGTHTVQIKNTNKTTMPPLWSRQTSNQGAGHVVL